jgi:pentatricopeptide repeat protein
MDMTSQYQDAFMQACYMLRYEITCGSLLFLLWCVGKLAGGRHKPTRSKASTLFAKASEKTVYEPPTNANNQDTERSPPILSSVANVGSISAKQLCDSAWLVSQVTQLCRTHVQQALALHRASLKAGMKPQDMPAADCRQLYTALVTSTVRTSLMEEAMQLLRDLRAAGVSIFPGLFASVVKLCTSKHLFAECLTFYDFVAEDPNFALSDKTIWSCLLFSAIEVRAYQRCEIFFERLKECGTPSHKDYGNMVRLASLHGDCKLSVKLIKEMRESNIEIDCVIYNTCLATCVSAAEMDKARLLLEDMERADGVADVITYNTLMKGYAKTGRMDECVVLFEALKSRNIEASQVTYGILLDGFINDNQLEKAAVVFSEMTSNAVPMNTVLYTTLIKGFARAGEVDHAMRIYEQMRAERNMPPDLITFSILIKANCDIDRLDTALKLLESMLGLGLRPDEVVFNNLLSGCARQTNSELGKRLYSDMLKSGIRPSNATFSILIRLYQQCKLLEDAVEMLRTEPKKHRVNPEPRLFLQLISSCIRDRQGRRAIEVYDMMMQHSIPQASAHSSIITTCVKLNMYDTAAEILSMAAAKGGRVDRADASSLLEGAVRKRKTQIATDIAASMRKLGFAVDSSLGV